ncbi:MAG: PorV/PorQ family protein, partial [bacterium]
MRNGLRNNLSFKLLTKRTLLLLWVCFVALLAFNSLVDASSYGSKATAAGNVLELPVDARAIGMGGAYTAVTEKAASVYWNPAGLALLENDTISFMHAAYFESVIYNYLAYAFPMEKLGVLGVGLQYLNYGTIEKRDNLGRADEDMTPRDVVLSLSYSRILLWVPTGFTFKVINSKIVNTATTAALDIGCKLPIFTDKVLLGATVRNLGGQLKYSVEKDPLPLGVNIGLSYRCLDQLLLAVEGSTSQNTDP